MQTSRPIKVSRNIFKQFKYTKYVKQRITYTREYKHKHIRKQHNIRRRKYLEFCKTFGNK